MSEPFADDLFKPLETAIRQRVIPALTGQPTPNDNVRKLLSLPARLGGLGIVDPAATATIQWQASEATSAPLVAIVFENGQCCDNNLAQEGILEVVEKQKTIERRFKKNASKPKRRRQSLSLLHFRPPNVNLY